MNAVGTVAPLAPYGRQLATSCVGVHTLPPWDLFGLATALASLSSARFAHTVRGVDRGSEPQNDTRVHAPFSPCFWVCAVGNCTG